MAAGVFDDPVRMEQLVQAIERASRAAEQLADVAVSAAREFDIAVTDIERDVRGAAAGAVQGAREVEHAWIQAYRAMEREQDRFEQRWRAAAGLIKHQLQDATSGITAGTGGVMGISGPKGILSGLQGVQGQLLGQLPMGGLIGLMLYGAKRDEGFRATTAGILRTMDSLAGHTKAQAREVGADVQSFFKAWGSNGEEVLATMKSLSEFNIGDEQMEKVGQTMTRAGVSVQRLATGLDMLDNLAPGTSAKLLGSAAESTGQGLAETTNELLQLHEAAHLSGMDFGLLASSMTQSLSSLRLQRQGVADLGSAYLKLHEGFKGQGMTNQQAATAAMKGMGAAASGVGGMNEGLMGYVAQRVQQRTGMGSGDPFEAMMSLKFGGKDLGLDNNYLTTVIEELQKTMEESVGGGKYKQIGALTKLGFSDEAARAIITMGRGGTSMKDLQEAFEDPQKLMLRAFEKRNSAADQWEATMRKVFYDMGKVGANLLVAVWVGFQALGAALVHISKGRGDEAAGVLNRANNIQTEAATGLIGAFTSLGNDVGGFGKILSGGVNFDTGLEASEERHKKEGEELLRSIYRAEHPDQELLNDGIIDIQVGKEQKQRKQNEQERSNALRQWETPYGVINNVGSPIRLTIIAEPNTLVGGAHRSKPTQVLG